MNIVVVFPGAVVTKQRRYITFVHVEVETINGRFALPRKYLWTIKFQEQWNVSVQVKNLPIACYRTRIPAYYTYIEST